MMETSFELLICSKVLVSYLYHFKGLKVSMTV